jgi:rhomboid protease GluP
MGGGIFNFGGISSRVLFTFGASLPFPYDLLQPWRYVTAIFLHGSLLHIGFNMWVLWDIGPMVEDVYGSARYFFLFVLTGIVGYIASSFFGYFSIGASGALLGLIGALLAVTMKHPNSSTARMLRNQLLLWLFFIAVLVFMPGIDNVAHAGGFVAGFLLGRVMEDRQPVDPGERKRAYALGWLAGAAVVLSFVMMASQFLRIR